MRLLMKFHWSPQSHIVCCCSLFVDLLGKTHQEGRHCGQVWLQIRWHPKKGHQEDGSHTTRQIQLRVLRKERVSSSIPTCAPNFSVLIRELCICSYCLQYQETSRRYLEVRSLQEGVGWWCLRVEVRFNYNLCFNSFHWDLPCLLVVSFCFSLGSDSNVCLWCLLAFTVPLPLSLSAQPSVDCKRPILPTLRLKYQYLLPLRFMFLQCLQLLM